ncbi:hypothetical protein [Paenibacillus terreus]
MTIRIRKKGRGGAQQMYTIGIVGPSLSIDRTLHALSDLELELRFETFPYEHARETADIIRRSRDNVHGWVFTGPIPYLSAQAVLLEHEHATYCPPTGGSLYKAILQAVYTLGRPVERLSIDMPDNDSWGMRDSLRELAFSEDQVHKYLFSVDYSVEDMVEHHARLWQEGTTEAAFTCLYAVYEGLVKLKVPVFKIDATKIDSMQAVRMLVERIRSSAFKDSQLGVLMLEMDRLHEEVQKTTERYRLQHLELKIKSLLLEHCDRIDGSLHQDGTGRYLMFGSRGQMQRSVEELNATITQLELDTGLKALAGIGFGETALVAENNARKAILYAKESKSGGVVLFEADGTIIEASAEQEPLAYHYLSHDTKLLKKLNRAGVSIRTYQKIKAYMRRIGREEVTAAELASGLSMTTRHVQRILGSLTECGAAEITGSELHSRRGRPSNRYRLL